jgi:transposase
MITLTPQMRILLAVAPVDFRKGIDGLVAVCRQVLHSEPFGGTLFVFRSRSRRALKLLVYDGQGFWLFQKRLSAGRFAWWPRSAEQGTVRLEPHQLHLLLRNGDPDQGAVAPLWRPLATVG